MRSMPAYRWLITVVVASAVVGLPVVPRLLPVADPGLSTATLLDRVRAAGDQGWSGYVETQGTLQLPSTGELDGLGALLGESTRLRVWWRGPDSWRVDRLLAAGESDLRHDGGTTVAYSYEAQGARVSVDPDIRLPRTSDLLPTELARHLLGDQGDQGDQGARDDLVAADDLERLPARRVAGVATAGLRLDGDRVAGGRSTIDRVDLWVDPATGVTLRIEVWARDAGAAAFSSEVRDYTAAMPDASVVAFDPTATTDVERVDVLDIADAADQYAPLRPPASVAGLARQDSSRGAVGVYGTGLTQLIAIPLRGREAGPLREQVAVTPGATEYDDGIGATVGPLGLLVTGRGDESAWLLAGTLTQPVLRRAGRDLLAGTTYVEVREP